MADINNEENIEDIEEPINIKGNTKKELEKIKQLIESQKMKLRTKMIE